MDKNNQELHIAEMLKELHITGEDIQLLKEILEEYAKKRQQFNE